MIYIRHIFIVILVLIMLTACMEVPSRETGRLPGEPVLWLYEAIDDASANLYRKIGDELPVKIAEGIIPGSHRAADDRVLILDREFRLYYTEDDHEPFLLFDNIVPYSYGFVDEGRKVFAVTRDGQLILRTFGMDEQLLAEHVRHVVPLRNRLLAQTEEGSVYTYDYYGREQLLAEQAIHVASLSPDDIYALIITRDAAVVTNGVEQLYRLDQAESLSQMQIASDGSTLLYVDRYDAILGTGALHIRSSDSDAGLLLADEVDRYEWDAERGLIWYTTGGKLHRYEMASGADREIAEDVRVFAISDASGQIAVLSSSGALKLLDSDGARLDRISIMGQLQHRIAWHGDVLLYITEDGMTWYLGEDGAASLGAYDHWQHDGERLIGVHSDAVITIDRLLRESILLENLRPYLQVYYDERLLAESYLRVDDLAGNWTTADGRQLLIRSTGRMKGTLAIEGADPIPFYVLFAAQDELKLLLASRPEEAVYMKLLSDDRLQLTIGEDERYMAERAAGRPER